MTLITRAWWIIRAGLGYGVFGLGSLLLGILLLGLITLPARRRHILTRRAISLAARLYLRFLSGLGLVHFELPDPAPLQQPGQLVVANHPSLLDAIILMALMPDACFVVKAATAHNAFTSLLVFLAGYLPNDQAGPELVAKAAGAIGEGQVLMIFPEGTRTRDLNTLVFKRGAANIALQARCALLPVAIHLANPLLRKQDPWYQLPKGPTRFTLQLLPAIPTDALDPALPPGLQARQLNRLLHQRLSSELQLPD